MSMMSPSLFFFSILLYTVYGSYYPIINVTGTHYEIGYQIGMQTKDRIMYYINNYPSMPQLRQCLNDINCTNSLNILVEFNKKNYPNYVDELYGISNGSNINIEDIILLNFEMEIYALLNEIPLIMEMNLHCSDMLINNKQFIANGHNEDDWIGTFQSAYYVNATFINSTSSHSFFAFTYPGYLSGNAFGMNYYGTSLTVNYLFPENVSIPARALNFLSRQLLDAKDINNALDIITSVESNNSPYCSYGSSFNIGNGKFISNFEIGLNQYNEYKLHESTYSYHFNMYLRLNISQDSDPSSIHRLNRTNELIKENGLTSIQNIITILGDKSDNEYPLFRNSNPPDCCSTLATVIFDRINMKMNIYEHCNPKQCKPSLVIDMN